MGARSPVVQLLQNVPTPLQLPAPLQLSDAATRCRPDRTIQCARPHEIGEREADDKDVSDRSEGGSWGQSCAHGLWQSGQNHALQSGHGIVVSAALPQRAQGVDGGGEGGRRSPQSGHTPLSSTGAPQLVQNGCGVESVTTGDGSRASRRERWPM